MSGAHMAITGPDHPVFRGEDATECEAFVNIVARQALSLDKQRDNQWVADFAASCFTDNALRWWNSLDDETQGSWKLLRNAMLSRYRHLFRGRDGEEAEQFVRMVRERALDEGKLNDNDWLVTFASTCFVGDALRWHASLELSVQTDWIKLQRALLAQYPRDSEATLTLPSLVPTPAAAAPKPPIRGRIRVTKAGDDTKYYIGDSYLNGVYICLGRKDGATMTVEWDWPCHDSQALTIRDSPFGYDTMGTRVGYMSQIELVPMRRKTWMGPTLRGTAKTDIFKGWKVSASASCRDLVFDLVPMNEGGKRLYAELDRQQEIILVPWKSTNSLSLFLEPLP